MNILFWCSSCNNSWGRGELITCDCVPDHSWCWLIFDVEDKNITTITCKEILENAFTKGQASVTFPGWIKKTIKES